MFGGSVLLFLVRLVQESNPLKHTFEDLCFLEDPLLSLVELFLPTRPALVVIVMVRLAAALMRCTGVNFGTE
jgi:hypothetical protein